MVQLLVIADCYIHSCQAKYMLVHDVLIINLQIAKVTRIAYVETSNVL